MEIGLISPGTHYYKNNEYFGEMLNQDDLFLQTFHRNGSGISIALPLLVSLTPSHFSVEIIDENFEQIDFTKNYDLVGITGMTHQALRAYEISNYFRNNGVTTVIGGIHATVMPNEAMEHADAVVQGEAENLWPELLHDFENGNLKKNYSSHGLIDVKNIPTPRYDLIAKYPLKTIWIQATRGCPHNCEFCAASNIYGTRHRKRPIENIITEIKYAKSLFPMARIEFADDNLFLDKEFAHKLIEALTTLNIRYACQCDINIAEDPALLNALSNSGCICLFIGLESLSIDSLAEVSKFKAKKVDKYYTYIEEIQSRRIGVVGAFILGLNYDTPDTVNEIIEFINKTNLYAVQVTALMPLPGTRLRSKMISENRILPTKWDNYTCYDVNIIPNHMTPKELEKSIADIFKAAYNKNRMNKVMRYFLNISMQKDNV